MTDRHAGMVVSQVRLSAWLRIVLVASWGLLVTVLASSAAQRLAATGLEPVAVLEIIGAVVAAALLVSSVLASCTVRVTRERVTVSYWVFFRVGVLGAR